MVDFAKMNEQRQKERDWYNTDIGKAFRRFESCCESYWIKDQDPRVSDKRLRELSDALNKARQDFLKELRGW